MFRFFEELPNEILLEVFGQLPLKDQAAMSVTCRRFNNISKTSSLAIGSQSNKLLLLIRRYNERIYYSNVPKSDDYNHKNPNFSYVEESNDEINTLLAEIEYLISKGIKTNPDQLLHEAMLLYFKYKGFLEDTICVNAGYDYRQPNFMFKLISLLSKFGADLSVKYNSKYSFSCGSLPFKTRSIKTFDIEGMDELTPLEYAEKFQDKYPEIYDLLGLNQKKIKIK